MEKNKKELKILSVVILALALFSAVEAIVSFCLTDWSGLKVMEGMTEEGMKIAVVIAFVVGLVLILPQVYVGVKGIRVANGVRSGRAHMTWAIVLAVLSGIALISECFGLAQGIDADKIIGIADLAVDVALYVCYYNYARKIANA